ncbi:MAG: hypothetical protein ACK55F_16050, partial [Acidobacteriota bacterium]
AAEVGRPSSGAFEPDQKLGPEFSAQSLGYSSGTAASGFRLKEGPLFFGDSALLVLTSSLKDPLAH